MSERRGDHEGDQEGTAPAHKKLLAVGDVQPAFYRARDGRYVEEIVPDTEPDNGSQFNSLRAIVSITRRIYDTRLLPPHSRTLNHSVLKRMMEATALYSNRTIKDYYVQYKQTDVMIDDLLHMTDKDLRDRKKDVREYVDRLLVPSVFLETEIPGGPFTAAFNVALGYVRKLAGDDNHVFIQYLHGKKQENRWSSKLSWKSSELARVLVRHADMRGNVVQNDRNTDQLFDRYNWYNSVQHTWGDLFEEYVRINTHKETSLKKISEFMERVRHLKPPLQPAERPPAELNDPDWLSSLPNLYHKPAAAAAEGPPTHIGAKGTPHPDTPHPDWADFCKTFSPKLGWDLHDTIRDALALVDENGGMKTDEPLTAFDIALLGGLHPRTHAMEKYFMHNRFLTKDSRGWYQAGNFVADVANQKGQPDAGNGNAVDQPAANFSRNNVSEWKVDKSKSIQLLSTKKYLKRFQVNEFYENCMAYFDSREDRSEDLGHVIYRTPLGATSKHTSYLPFRRAHEVNTEIRVKKVDDRYEFTTVKTNDGKVVMPSAAPKVSFGAPSAKGGREDSDSDDPKAEYKKPSRIVSRDHRKKVDEVDTEVDNPYLERYCDQCFERGVELYLRLIHVMIEDHLAELRRDGRPEETSATYTVTAGLRVGTMSVARVREHAARELHLPDDSVDAAFYNRNEVQVTVRVAGKAAADRAESALETGLGGYGDVMSGPTTTSSQAVAAGTSNRDDFLKAFAKMIGLIIQRAELANPRIQFINTAAAKDARRMNARGMNEAMAALSSAFGRTLAMETCGYEDDGIF